MQKQPANGYQAWTAANDAQLRALVQANTPTRLIARQMGRTPQAISARANRLGISLKPTTFRPYWRAED